MATFSKREQKIMDRLKASGHVTRNVQLDARLTFVIRTFTTVGVEKGNLASLFKEETRTAIKIKNLIRPSPELQFFQLSLIAPSLLCRATM